MKTAHMWIGVVLICACLGLEAWYFGSPTKSEDQWKWFLILSAVNLCCFWTAVKSAWGSGPFTIARDIMRSFWNIGPAVALEIDLPDFVFMALQPVMFAANLGYLLISRF